MTEKTGYYSKEPGADIAIRQLNYKAPTANSKGLRFGNFLQGREVFEEEMEAVFQGKKDAKVAMQDATRRGNDSLRSFEAANRERGSGPEASPRLPRNWQARRLPLGVAALR